MSNQNKNEKIACIKTEESKYVCNASSFAVPVTRSGYTVLRFSALPILLWLNMSSFRDLLLATASIKLSHSKSSTYTNKKRQEIFEIMNNCLFFTLFFLLFFFALFLLHLQSLAQVSRADNLVGKESQTWRLQTRVRFHSEIS